ncbi:capsid cement protein [Citrobacter koseri]|uniref:capsid cement protein n=1 Tax=Citrobacter koseri TaxID=545 RepID=UPI000E13A419|nr:capsid cement protein [Citrobacter koseri]STA77339.1 Uncharacterized conserved protein [Citrobacter koseri]
MAKNYQQDGNTLDFHNTGAADIHSGEAVLSGALVGVAHDDIPAGLWAYCIPQAYSYCQRRLKWSLLVRNCIWQTVN